MSSATCSSSHWTSYPSVNCETCTELLLCSWHPTACLQQVHVHDADHGTYLELLLPSYLASPSHACLEHPRVMPGQELGPDHPMASCQSGARGATQRRPAPPPAGCPARASRSSQRRRNCATYAYRHRRSGVVHILRHAEALNDDATPTRRACDLADRVRRCASARNARSCLRRGCRRPPRRPRWSGCSGRRPAGV